MILTGTLTLCTYLQVIAYTGNDDGKKFVLDKEVTTDNVKVGALSYICIPLQISCLLPVKLSCTCPLDKPRH